MEDVLPIVIAAAPDALVELCGVNLLERSLRILQRLGFRRAIVFSSTPEIIGPELAKYSWARKEIIARVVATAGPITPAWILEQTEASRLLILPANLYCDARLLDTLSARNSPTLLIDSNPPQFIQHLTQNPSGPALMTRNFLLACSSSAPAFEQFKQKIDAGEIDAFDAANVDDYIVSMRRHVRPLCFPLPRIEERRVAERIILNGAQKGTLDLPAYVHAPIETAIVSLLCKTRITPNQITIAGFIVGCSATAAFVLGRVGWGILAALAFGIVDGLDGKLARVKIETTERGKWEHHLDYLIENSWWAGIAFHLWQSAQLSGAFYFLALLIASHLLDELVKRRAKIATGRLLDDFAPFDRGFRLIAARRNIYVWVMAAGFLLGAFPKSYATICGWAAVTAVVHVVRSVWICGRIRSRVIDSRT